MRLTATEAGFYAGNMTSLPNAISELSRAEKFELLDALWTDLESDTHAAVSEEETAELDRRVAKYEQNRDAVTSWEELKAAVRR